MNLSSVEKAFLLLEYLAGTGKPASLNEVTQAVQMPKPTTYRLLRSLQEMGYVARPLGSRDYGIGPRASQLGAMVRAYDPYHALKEAARPWLVALHGELDETVNLGVLSGNHVLYLDYLETTQPLRYIVTPGERDLYHTTALGRAIASRLDAPTLKVLAPTDQLRQLFARVRKAGYAEEVEEAVAGVACLAVSLDALGHPEAAISVAVPVQRLDGAHREAIIAALRRVRV